MINVMLLMASGKRALKQDVSFGMRSEGQILIKNKVCNNINNDKSYITYRHVTRLNVKGKF